MLKSGYRPDIDGLRAIAVISVVVFHFNNGWLPGGFIGVDVFFVISGFLITGIVHREVVEGKFTFRAFFIRRVRRILPAALFVTLMTLLVGMMFMLPADSKDLAESAFASTISLANVFFWLFLDNGYFAASTDTVPLLHMWSLGVEEQFYLVWPFILLVSYKAGGTRLLMFISILLAVCSFVFSEYYVGKDPDFAYYMLPARAGELLVGCVTYMLVRKASPVSGKAVSNLFFIIGGSILFWSFLYIDKASGFPGAISLVPTVGAALLIASGSVGNSSLIKVLSFKPMVWIGVLSFSLYLWHWPILAFYRYAYGEPTLMGGLTCLILIVACTLFSYRYIETPFRRLKVGRVSSSAFAAAIGVAVIAFSGLVYSKDGYVNEDYALKVNSMEERTKAAFSFPYVCQTSNFSEGLLRNERCLLGPADQAPSVLIWGDSNAAHYVGYFKVVAEHAGIPMRNVNHSSCVPFFNNSSKFVSRNKESCERFNRAIKDEIENYDTVVVGASWNSYFSRGEGFEEELRATLDHLSGVVGNVIVAKKIPIFRGYDRQCSQKAITIPLMDCSERSRMENNGDHDVNELIEAVVSEYGNVTTFSIREHVCDGAACYAYLKNMPVYYDPGHLSLLGSEALGKKAINEGSVPEVLKLMVRENM